MKKDAMKELYQELELFDKPALFTNNRLDRDSVPDGLYCYDIRGSDEDFGSLSTLEKFPVIVNHSGSIICGHEIGFDEDAYLVIEDEIGFTGDELYLYEFILKHDVGVSPIEFTEETSVTS